ncbi:uncharacterized protein LAESUDRAFT_716908 [Laetiporus sulphureus 93-53]|uniref:F-box domain-containing protein n=1 Tax=Laetiporus sulphureus 93-53 TaxID=1314785 RepID=A0A165CBJ0_9APHY|nr:uncharacterized protein LAESUDRAFT_716908 [Laetiporus sulphureus 93-53]KZT02509.1 hypothetical protein LAESUDRAFT_716908 [Laetiporus sulphureus 93-53]
MTKAKVARTVYCILLSLSLMLAPIESLPPELYTHILSHIPSEDLQQTVLALTRAAARSPIPIYHLFERVRLRHGDQVIQLYRRLRKNSEDAAWVRHFSLECWTVDADVVVNLLALLAKLRELTLFIGPFFAPEHLEEMFQKPMEELRFISLRFRPYVQRATYYQFLKVREGDMLGAYCSSNIFCQGAYFDSTLLAFSRWPAGELPTLSIVQEPLDPSIAPTKFAQPLVFFRLDTLSTLALCPLLENLHHFRLRVPTRQAARFLYALPNALPNIELLDMSTCNVVEADVEGMLGRFDKLKALVLDGCHIVSQRADVQGQDGETLGHWAGLGKTMALAGVKYAREREKRLKLWLEASHARAAAALAGIEPAVEQAPMRRQPRRGRRGLATATVSLRNSPPKDTIFLPKVPSTSRLPLQNQRIRILPSLPTIHSLATTTPVSMGPEKHGAIRVEFERGWAEGVMQLSAIRGRLRQSWGNGMRVVMFDRDYEPDEEDGDGEDGLAGLKDVEDEGAFVVPVVEDSADGHGEKSGATVASCPILCLAGPGRKEGHIDGCGHQLGWGVWRDDL